MGLFDKKQPVPTDTNTAGTVPGASVDPLSDMTTTQPVVQESVVPTSAASTVAPQEPVVAETSVGTGDDLTDDSVGATVSPTSVASEKTTVSAPTSLPSQEPFVQVKSAQPEVSAPPAPPNVSVGSTAPGVNSVGSMNRVSVDEQPDVSVEDNLGEAGVSSLGKTPAETVTDDNEDTEGGTGTGLKGM